MGQKARHVPANGAPVGDVTNRVRRDQRDSVTVLTPGTSRPVFCR